MLKNMTAEQFNAKYPVGTACQFHPIIDEPHFEATKTRSEAWTLGHGAAVVKVEGRTGCVLLEALSFATDIGAETKYPLEIENIGGERYTLMSRGHHSFDLFMAAVRKDYSWQLGEPRHLWFKTLPNRRYVEVKKDARGAWPVTYVTE
jgi:hypothetical protein